VVSGVPVDNKKQYANDDFGNLQMCRVLSPSKTLIGIMESPLPPLFVG
jgi:hypothetical protein